MYFDQFDSQVRMISVAAGPRGVRRVGRRLTPDSLSMESDETVQKALGPLREYFTG